MFYILLMVSVRLWLLLCMMVCYVVSVGLLLLFIRNVKLWLVLMYL